MTSPNHVSSFQKSTGVYQIAHLAWALVWQESAVSARYLTFLSKPSMSGLTQKIKLIYTAAEHMFLSLWHLELLTAFYVENYLDGSCFVCLPFPFLFFQLASDYLSRWHALSLPLSRTPYNEHVLLFPGIFLFGFFKKLLFGQTATCKSAIRETSEG